MESEKRFCPFKRQIETGYKNGKRTMQEKYIKCCGSMYGIQRGRLPAAGRYSNEESEVKNMARKVCNRV